MNSLLEKDEAPLSKVKEMTKQGWKFEDVVYVIDALEDIVAALNRPKKIKSTVSRNQAGLITEVITKQIK